MTLLEFQAEAKAALIAAGCEMGDPDSHIRLLVEAALGWSTSEILIRQRESLTIEQLEKLRAWVDERISGEPLQYLAKEAGFWKSRFAVGPGVLIPRPETELLVEECLKRGDGLTIFELGAGTGNIGLSVLAEKPDWEWHAFEINPRSLPYVEKNRRAFGDKARSYHLHAEDFFTGAEKLGLADGLVTNPPYISETELGTLSKEVQCEPRRALAGGPRGTEIIERLITQSDLWLKPAGFFLCEMGAGQGDFLSEIARGHFSKVSVIKDYAGHDRVLKALK